MVIELYKDLSYTALSGAQNFEFDDISELVGRISFLIKGSILLNRDTRELEGGQKAFVEKPDPFKQELIDYIFKELKHKKTQHP